jgi:hypothetical protein
MNTLVLLLFEFCVTGHQILPLVERKFKFLLNYSTFVELKKAVIFLKVCEAELSTVFLQ